MKRLGARAVLISCVVLWVGTLWALSMGALATEAPVALQSCVPLPLPPPAGCEEEPSGSPSPSASGSSTPSPSPSDDEPTTEKPTISIKYAKNKFSGVVKSKTSFCERGRDVSVKKKGGKVVGSDTTNRAGKYNVRFPEPKGKRYFAKVAPRVGGQTSCQGAKSKTIKAR
jgi:hypothetical protein